MPIYGAIFCIIPLLLFSILRFFFRSFFPLLCTCVCIACVVVIGRLCIWLVCVLMYVRERAGEKEEPHSLRIGVFG